MKKTVLLSLLAVLAFAERSGPYAGAAYGTTAYDDGSYFSYNGYNRGVDDSSDGFRLYGGAYINSYLSVEIDYTDFGDYEARNGVSNRLSEGFTAIGVSTLVHYPVFEERLDWFVKLGAADVSWEESGALKRSDNAGAILYGAGVGYRFAPSWTVKVGYEHYDFDMLDGLKSYDWSIDHAFAAIEVQF